MSVQIWVDKRKAEEVTGFSWRTLRNWRLQGNLTEGIHYKRINKRNDVYYNHELLNVYIANIGDSNAHQVAIDNYLRSLPSNQKRKRKVS